MTLRAQSIVSTEVNSKATGIDLGRRLGEAFEEPPAVVLVHTTIDHDGNQLLQGVREAVGSSPLVVGCSSQGVMGRGVLHEAGYVAGGMALGGEGIAAATAAVCNIVEAPREKGRSLGARLVAGLAVPPEIVVVYYDPLCGADVGELLEGLQEAVPCPVIGAGAGQDFGPMVATYQFHGDAVHQGAAVAMALGGALSVDLVASHGTTPIGVSMKVTKTDGPCLLELDGKRAVDVWAELCGVSDPQIEHAANMAIGLPAELSPQHVCRVLAPFGTDRKRGGIIMHTSIAVGTEIMFHHRTESGVRNGTVAMAQQLVERLGGRRPRALIGFECGARAAPFLGSDGALAENLELQGIVGTDAAWLGMLAWGEVYPLHRGSAVFNFTYPLLCLSD